jgi:hypothetical protein
MSRPLSNWISPKPELLPDFIIGGAMKSGTSTLHHILQSHPDVFIPNHEVHFFDMDNMLQHPDFNFFHNNEWIHQFLHDDPDQYWKWYGDFFRGHTEKVLGEDSTTYLASSKAAYRIAQQPKEIKLIFLLRNPTERSYSHYLHDLRKGRMTHSFENVLRFNPHSVLDRSLYYDQLKTYYKFIPKDQIKVILFENFIRDQKNTLRDICDFLDLDFNQIPSESLNRHSNPAKLPLSISLQYFKNRIFRSFAGSYYNDRLPNTPQKVPPLSYLSYLIHYLHLGINPPLRTNKPKLKPSTRNLLNNYFKTKLNGLDDLIDQDISSLWFKQS